MRRSEISDASDSDCSSPILTAVIVRCPTQEPYRVWLLVVVDIVPDDDDADDVKILTEIRTF